MHGATNTIGIVFVPRFFIEDRNGAALTLEGGFAYQQVMIKDANGKDVLTHAPIPFNPHNPKFLCFRRFKAALRWLRSNSIPGKPEIKETKMMKHVRTPLPSPAAQRPMQEHGFFCASIPKKYQSTPEMYRRRGMKGHALFMLYGGVNFRAMRERMRQKNGNVAALIPVVRRKKFNAELEAAA